MSGLGAKLEKMQATREWLERQQMPSTEEVDEVESLAESSIVESSDGDYETETDTDLENTVSTTALGTQVLASTDVTTMIEHLKELLNSINSVQTVDNVSIENSSNVHIGNITNINGNIQIIQRIKHHSPQSKRKDSKTKNPTEQKQESRSRAVPKTMAGVEEECEERVRRDAFMDHIKFKIPKDLCAIVPRGTWLAQTPMDEYTYQQEPVEYVIISHTATESSEKQAVNIRIIRDIQCFHIESREWNDIAYNFLIGCDGNVYEGRGWGVVGAHTMGYNVMSLGISFIGCFMRTLPSEAALNACKSLLKRGVEEGHLAVNYKLLCHCQCRSTESPGRKLFEEIKNWEHFYNIEEE